MAGSCTCHSPRHKPTPGSEDKLARGPARAPTKGNNTLTHSPAISWAPTPAPPSTNELFKRFIKAYLESNQGPSQPPAERKWPLKAKVPDIYYGKVHIDCYHFCQQCEDHFEISRATGTNQISFGASFFYRNISVWWM